MNETDLQSMRAYLAERDVPCPGCGYSLRGAQDPVCPECGGPVELSIARNDRGRGYWLLLLVALGWMAISGGMEATRAGRSVESESRIVRPFASFVSFSSSTNLRISGSGSGQTIIINGQPTKASSPFVISGPKTSPTAGPTATRNWAQVAWTSWARLGWSGGVACAGLAGLAFVIVLRRRAWRDGPGRRLVTGVVALAALHLSVQIFLFVRELTA